MKKRENYLDILKVIALVCMVLIHTYEVLSNFNLLSNNVNINIFTKEVSIIYIITPTIFMFAMGAGIYLSKNNTPGKMAKRGLKLLLTGLILNAIRGALVFLILGYKIDSLYYSEAWYWLWGSDILFFAGLFFLLYALFKKLKIHDNVILVIGIAMFIISNIINVTLPYGTLAMVVGNFIRVDADSYFPLLTWFIIPLLGYNFQKYLDKSKNKDKYVLKIMILNIILLISFLVITISNNIFLSRYIFWGEEGFIIDTPTLILTLSINYIYIGIIYYISKLIKKCPLINDISMKLTKTYFIHWIIVMYLGLLLILYIDYKVPSILLANIIGIIITVISYLLAKLFNKKKVK